MAGQSAIGAEPQSRFAWKMGSASSKFRTKACLGEVKSGSSTLTCVNTGPAALSLIWDLPEPSWSSHEDIRSRAAAGPRTKCPGLFCLRPGAVARVDAAEE